MSALIMLVYRCMPFLCEAAPRVLYVGHVELKTKLISGYIQDI